MPANRDDTGIRLSPARRRWLNAQVRSGRFADLNQALEFCVEQATRLEKARAGFARLIAEGDVGPFDPVDDKWWASLRADAAAARRRAPRQSA